MTTATEPRAANKNIREAARALRREAGCWQEDK